MAVAPLKRSMKAREKIKTVKLKILKTQKKYKQSDGEFLEIS